MADEIASDFETQLDTLERLGISRLDLRGVGDTNVLDLYDEQVERVQTALDEQGFEVTSLTSPIGKVGIEESFESQVEYE